MSVERIFWTVCIPCAAIANVLAFWIFARMGKLGFERGIWNWGDLRLYRLYWDKAPENRWSRTPLVAMGALMAVTICALFLAALFNWGK